ncbi:hypothetical protein DFR41_104251 [Pseudacidovorax intermedius]|uniref:Uncharacterized protein n=1 Tax=Pseudacidovorax intermedius TaxID=433924 RepID=A0A370FHS5_9BURK|nr:hypothetical protein [Pseudacidovorax intermedius]RDI25194.1 hypothetical protein DFR41_104251 [Pseudacidovorax intermedius]
MPGSLIQQGKALYLTLPQAGSMLGPELTVYQRRDGETAAHVVLHLSHAGFVASQRLTPAEARDLARRLLMTAAAIDPSIVPEAQPCPSKLSV